MPGWLLGGRRITYDGEDAGLALLASLDASCPCCAAPLLLLEGGHLAPGAVHPLDRERLGPLLEEPVPGCLLLLAEPEIGTDVHGVRCRGCDADLLVACSHREWQPGRWVALEPRAVTVRPAPRG